MTTDSEQFAPELLQRNGIVAEPALSRLATARRDGESGRPQLDFVGDENPLPVRIANAADDRVPSVAVLWESPWVQVPYGATSGALDANDALGNKITFEYGVDGTRIPRHGRILSVEMIDPDDDTLAATIHIYSHDFVAAASDAAYTVGLGDAENIVAAEAFDAGTDEGSFKFHAIKDVNAEFGAPERRLYAQLSTTGTPNIASAAVMPKVKIFVLPME